MKLDKLEYFLAVQSFLILSQAEKYYILKQLSTDKIFRERALINFLIKQKKAV